MRTPFRHAALPVANETPAASDQIKLARLLQANIKGLARTGALPDLRPEERIYLFDKLLQQATLLDGVLERINEDTHEKTKLVTLDALTGIHNRRYFEPALETAIVAADVSGAPLALLALDIDHFGKVNNIHGHAAGDTVLKIFAQQLRKGVKEKDLVARFGGEEFMIALPGAPRIQALRIANRLRTSVAARPMELGAPAITVSIGLAMYEKGETSAMFKERADVALYDAKNRGRNRVKIARSGPPPLAIQDNNPGMKPG